LSANEILLNQVILQTNSILEGSNTLKNLTKRDFGRAIFLGSGPLVAIARECHLKLQELTDGAVICKHDSFLGFRHGPRVVANDDTIMIYLFSNDTFIRKYEHDMTTKIAEENPEIPVVSIGTSTPPKHVVCVDLGESAPDSNIFYIIPYVLIGQLLG